MRNRCSPSPSLASLVRRTVGFQRPSVPTSLNPKPSTEAASLLQVSAERSHYHYAFYVLLENNHHRSSDAYVQMLDRLCRFSSKSQLKNGPEGEVRIVGDHEAIHERVPSCANMTYGTPMTLADLGYSDVVDKLPKEGSSTCTLKFLGPELQHNVATRLSQGSRAEDNKNSNSSKNNGNSPRNTY